MKHMLLASLVFLLAARASAADMPLDTPWKKAVYSFTADKLQHSAWGLAHSERDYLTAVALAKEDHVQADDDVLFAAAFLHDMGGFPEFAQAGVDHAVRSAALVEGVLKPTGFPEAKIPAVKQAILTHSYYNPELPVTPEAILLHDADCLDFLGAVSVARIVSLTERDRAAPNLAGAVRTLRSLLDGVPPRIVGAAAKRIGARRAADMRTYLERLSAETFNLDAL
jgi:uncharacterized protein